MARFALGEYISIGTGYNHTATSWQAGLDSTFSVILDEVFKSKEYLTHWISALPKPDGCGYFSDLDEVYVRVKVWEGDTCSDWFILPTKNQNDQTLDITENGVVVDTVNTLTHGIRTKGIYKRCI